MANERVGRLRRFRGPVVLTEEQKAKIEKKLTDLEVLIMQGVLVVKSPESEGTYTQIVLQRKKP